MLNQQLFYVLLIAILNSIVVGSSAPIGSVPMRVVNHAGSSIELFWIDHFNAQPGAELKLVKQTTKPIRNSTDATVNKFH